MHTCVYQYVKNQHDHVSLIIFLSSQIQKFPLMLQSYKAGVLLDITGGSAGLMLELHWELC